MAKPRKAPPKVSDLKARILTETRALVVAEGLEGLSMRKVAQRCGCTATAIYLYFRDKEALLEALVLEDFLDLARDLEALRSVPDPLERLRRLALAFAAYALAKPAHYRFLFLTPRPALGPEASAGRNHPEVNAYLLGREAAEAALTAGLVRADIGDADALLQTLLAGIHGVVSLHLVRFQDPALPWHPVEARITRMLEVLLRGIRTET